MFNFFFKASGHTEEGLSKAVSKRSHNSSFSYSVVLLKSKRKQHLQISFCMRPQLWCFNVFHTAPLPHQPGRKRREPGLLKGSNTKGDFVHLLLSRIQGALNLLNEQEAKMVDGMSLLARAPQMKCHRVVLIFLPVDHWDKPLAEDM